MANVVERRLRDLPVVVLTGARQTRKSTLARALEKGPSRAYRALDDIQLLDRSRNDPNALVHSRLLESAVLMPRQQFGGRYLHPDIAAMTAAYLYHIVRNHPLLDGNKRTGPMAAFVFPDANGIQFAATAQEAEDIVVRGLF